MMDRLMTTTRKQPDRLRVAFLTPEHVVNHPRGGGLASYLTRICRALIELGHEPEVITTGNENKVCQYEGVRVEQVTPANNTLLSVLGSHWRSRLKLSATLTQLKNALGMAQALERRHHAAPFDLVQSSDFGLAGYYVKQLKYRNHAVRCSWSRRLYQQYSPFEPQLDDRLLARLERNQIRRCRIAYAPSRFIADHLSREFGIDVKVIRPPLFMPESKSPDQNHRPDTLPTRYMIHFGQLSPLKGTDVLAEALAIVWQRQPDFTMIWAGTEPVKGWFSRLANHWSLRINQLTWLGPVSRKRLNTLLRFAEAAVLPSRCDNLPNTVIESLALNIPVVGSDGASIDELVDHGITGRLVAIGDAEALADTLIDLWRNPMKLNPDAVEQSAALREMEPAYAAAGLAELAWYGQEAIRLAA